MVFLRLLALILLVASCNSSREIPPETEEHKPSTPIGEEYPVPNVKKVFTVKIEALNYTQEQTAKLREAEVIIAKIFNSEAYKKAVLSNSFTNTKGLSNLQIYEKLYEGAEALQPAVNYQLDLKVEMYYSFWSKVIGYTYPETLVVYTHSKFYDYYTACQMASNLVHEWTHKMGFDHTSAGDSTSVPYAHNDIVESLCKDL